MPTVRACAGILLAALLAAGCDALVSPQARIDRARADIESGAWGRAGIELHKAVESDPANADAWLLLARLSLDAADSSDAQSSLDHAVRAGARGAEPARLQADTWLATGRPAALIKALDQRTLALPKPERSIARARAYDELGQPDKALSVLQPTLAGHPAPIDARLTAADALALQGRFDPALQALAHVGDGDPKAWAVYRLRAEILARRGEFAAAERAFTHAIQLMSPATPLTERVVALIELTEARLASDELDAAAQSGRELAALIPGAPIVQLLGARIDLARGNYLEGVAALERVVGQLPQWTQAQLLLGTAQLVRGELEQAQSQLQQVVQRHPENVWARKLLALVSLKLDQPEKALQALAPALDTQAADPELVTLLGAAERGAGNGSDIIPSLERDVRANPADRALKLNLAEAYLRAGRPRDALPILQQTAPAGNLRRDRLLVAALDATQGAAVATRKVNEVLATHADDPEALDFAASYFASQSNFVQAEALLRKSLATHPGDAATVVSLARVEASAGDAGQAAAQLRAALATHPDALPMRIALAEALTSEKSFTEAEQVLEAASSAQGNPELWLALARVELAAGAWQRAQAALDRATALQPRSAELYNRVGMLLLAAGQYDGALARFRRASELALDTALYRLNIASAQLALNDAAAARESLEKAAQLRPGWLPPLRALTLIDLRAKDYDAALARVNGFLAVDPGDSEAMNLKADVELARGQPVAAAANYGNAYRRAPSADVAVKWFRARLDAHTPDPQRPLEQWLAAQPNDFRTRIVLGDYYLVTGSLRPAARQFEAAANLAPHDVVALNNLAWTYGKLADPRAQGVAQKAYALAPGAAVVNDTLGWILASRHQIDRALPVLARAVELDPADPEIAYHYAYALVQAGRRAEARKVLTKALAGGRAFDSRPAAVRLLADIRA